MAAYSRLDYSLPSTPVLVVLDDAWAKKQPALCRTYLALRRERSTFADRDVEKSLFPVVASAGFDCERVNRASGILAPLFDVLSRSSAEEIAPAFEISRLPLAVALQPKEREVLDVSRQFFGYVMRDERAKGLLLSALSSRQLALEGSTSGDNGESEMGWISEAIEEVTGQTLTAVWEQFLDQRISVELRKSRAAESCPTKAALHWEATADALSARLVCSPVYAMGG
jgi:hypothetical protein